MQLAPVLLEPKALVLEDLLKCLAHAPLVILEPVELVAAPLLLVFVRFAGSLSSGSPLDVRVLVLLLLLLLLHPLPYMFLTGPQVCPLQLPLALVIPSARCVPSQPSGPSIGIPSCRGGYDKKGAQESY